MGYGELTSILTAFCWAISSTCFEYSGKKIGSFNLNMTRLLFALFFFVTYNLLSTGMIIPVDMPKELLIFMALSGFIGMFLGDLLLFEAFVLLSARITLLIFFTVPPLTSVLSFIFLGDTMQFIEILAMVIILFGIYLVVNKKEADDKKSLSVKGLIFACGAALMQAIGNVLNKYVAVDYDAFFSAEIRVLAGIIAFAVLYTIKGHWKNYFKSFNDKTTMLSIAVASFFGPFLGIALTLISLQYINAGIASTLASVSPIILIPYTVFIKKEKLTARDIIGTFVAFIGLLLII